MTSATFTCQAPDQFNFVTNDWPKWKQRYERFRSVSDLKKKPEPEQVDSLIYTMGDQAELILHALKLSDEDIKLYNKVMEAFDFYFIGKRNVIYERAKFNMRVQLEGESVDEFITALHELSKYCSFETLTDELIRDRIVAGVKDRGLSEKMQLDSGLTLEKATTMARQSEKVKQQQATVHLETKEVKVARVKAKYKQDYHKSDCNKPDYHKQDRSTQQPRGVDNSRYVSHLCNFCGRTRHARKDCPALKAVCNSCKKRGHYAKVCKSKAQVREVTAQDAAFLGAVTQGIQNSEWSIKIGILGKKMTFKIDTGADVNVVPKRVMECFLPKVHLIEPERKLIGPDGKTIATEGMFSANLSYGDKTVKSVLYVVSHGERALLCGETSAKLNLIKRLCTVSEKIAASNLNPVVDFPHIFKGLGRVPDKYKITLTPEAKPYALTTPRRVPIPLMKKVKQKLEDMVTEGIIQPIDKPTDWCSPMVIVPKNNGELRVCVDLSALNRYISREIHPMPVSDHILGQLGQAKYFSKLDAYSGFWQFELEDESQCLTTFISPFGRFMFKRLPFGISSAPEFFQKKMSKLLMDLEGVVCNIDDILVFGNSSEEHDHRLRTVLKRISNYGLTLNKEKCQFGVKSVKFLGHLIDEWGIRPDPDKIKAIVEMSPPCNVSELKSFLGMINYHGKFIPDLATVAYPLHELLKSSTSWIWDIHQQSAFEELKKRLSTAPVLAKFDPEKETIVSADASSYGLGSVLKQQQTDGSFRPVAFASRSLNPAEKRYAQIEKEGLGLVWACEKFRDYITGLRIRLETDHKPLVAIFQSKMLDDITPRLQRLKLRLMRYTYDIFYTPGKLLITADTLSRKPLEVTEQGEFAEEIDAYVREVVSNAPISDLLLKRIQHEQEQDPVLHDVQRYCEVGWPTKNNLSQHIHPYWPHRADLSSINNLLVKGDRIVVPTSLREDILNRIHEGHLGINKCRMKARASVWWPGLSKAIETMVVSCRECIQENKNHREPLLPSTFPDRPWQKVAMDLFYLQRKWYLLVTDYFSRFPEIASLDSLSASVVITHVKSIFARHGIPELVISDNGSQFLPNFTSEFSKFANEWGFQHTTSSPKYAQSNGFVEAGVKIIKRSLKKSDESYRALLSYRSTPLSNNLSPAELLFGRRIRSQLPVATSLLQPKLVDSKALKQFENTQKEKQKKNYDLRHRTSSLPEIPLQQRVWITDMKQEGIVTSKADTPRSYIVQTPRGHLRRNRIHLIPLRTAKEMALTEPSVQIPEPPLEVEVSMDQEQTEQAQDNVGENYSDRTPEAKGTVPIKTAYTPKAPYITKSGRTVVKPKRFDD